VGGGEGGSESGADSGRVREMGEKKEGKPAEENGLAQQQNWRYTGGAKLQRSGRIGRFLIGTFCGRHSKVKQRQAQEDKANVDRIVFFG